MPIQHPHYVSSLAFRISGLFRISIFGFRISPDPSGTHRGVLCKTNPIYHPNSQKMRNEPNLPSRHPHNDPKIRNEPNLPPNPEIPRTGTACRAPKTQNEPNSHTATTRTTTQIRKTNPIPHSPGSPKATQPPNIQSTIYTLQSLLAPPFRQNEPNSRPATTRTTTQERKTNPIPGGGFTKRTQFTPTPTILPPKPPPITRNEPNLHRSAPVEAQICETNPISTPPPTQMRKTNPISTPQPSRHAGRRSVPIYRGTQFRPANSQQPEIAKQTQSAVSPPAPRPKCAKQTQSPPHTVFPPFSFLLSRGQQPAPTSFWHNNKILFLQPSCI